MSNNLDRLDDLAARWRATGVQPADVGVLSTAEALYVTLAASRVPEGYSIAAALARIGEAWVQELVERHRYG